MPATKKTVKKPTTAVVKKVAVAKKTTAVKKTTALKKSNAKSYIYEIANLTVTVPDLAHDSVFSKAPEVTLLSDINFKIPHKKILGLVGESGSGKTTLSRVLLKLMPISTGSLKFNGVDIAGLNRQEMLPLRQKMSIIFQDPFSALNPRMTIGKTIIAPLEAHNMMDNAEELLAQALENVGLPVDYQHRYPHQLSGGQRQRVGIARGIIARPDFIVADEISSGLDVSTQAVILDLLENLTKKMGITVLFVSHNLSVVSRLCDEVIVMRGGKIVEHAPTKILFSKPKERYTSDLIDAIPLPETGRNWLKTT